ncbi:Nudix hydrolase 2-like protein [Drosera capensis]
MFTSLHVSSIILFSLRKSLIGLALNHHQRNRHFLRYPVETFNLGRNLCRNHKGLIRVQRLMSSMRSISHVPGKEAAPAVAAEEEERVLVGRDDAYDGVIVEMKEKMEADAFGSLLRASLSEWRGMGKQGVWIKLPINLANLVEAAVNEGFYYHHAEPKYLMLVNWLSECPNTLPANATHRVGVGAFVINDRQEVLVVQEKNGILGGMGVWKFPTGIADEGEDISVAAVREVKEETGIDARFVEILTFRQSHKSFFQKSDLYFVCMLEPLSFDIQVQESELEAAKWMPFEEYAAQPFVQKHELLKNTVQICQAKMNRTYSGFAEVPIQASFREGKDVMYLNSHADID